MPDLHIIAGPNGAGKTTAAKILLPEIFYINEFVNADEIARGLSPLNRDMSAIDAGRIMLNRIDKLIDEHINFAFETTLASRSFIKLVRRVKKSGYNVHILFLWLNCPDLAEDRVAKRVTQGGHNIEKKVIYHRYQRGIKNLINLYMPIVDSCHIYDNSGKDSKIIVQQNGSFDIVDQKLWKKIKIQAQIQ